MSDPIKISVDGDHGLIVAQNPGIRIVNPNQALVAVSESVSLHICNGESILSEVFYVAESTVCVRLGSKTQSEHDCAIRYLTCNIS